MSDEMLFAGARSRTEYLSGPSAAGFVDVDLELTHETAPGMRGAIIRTTTTA